MSERANDLRSAANGVRCGRLAGRSLSDDELHIVMDCAQPLAPKDRDAFLRDVAAELEQHPTELGRGVVHRIARELQSRYFDPPSFVGCSAPRWRRKGRSTAAS